MLPGVTPRLLATRRLVSDKPRTPRYGAAPCAPLEAHARPTNRRQHRRTQDAPLTAGSDLSLRRYTRRIRSRGRPCPVCRASHPDRHAARLLIATVPTPPAPERPTRPARKAADLPPRVASRGAAIRRVQPRLATKASLQAKASSGAEVRLLRRKRVHQTAKQSHQPRAQQRYRDRQRQYTQA